MVFMKNYLSVIFKVIAWVLVVIWIAFLCYFYWLKWGVWGFIFGFAGFLLATIYTPFLYLVNGAFQELFTVIAYILSILLFAFLSIYFKKES